MWNFKRSQSPRLLIAHDRTNFPAIRSRSTADRGKPYCLATWAPIAIESLEWKFHAAKVTPVESVSLKPDRATTQMTTQLKMWKMSLTHTSDPTRPTRRGPDPIRLTRRVLTLTDPREGIFWKLAKTDIRCMRGRACAQSYIHAHLQQLGCAPLCGRPCGQVLGTLHGTSAPGNEWFWDSMSIILLTWITMPWNTASLPSPLD